MRSRRHSSGSSFFSRWRHRIILATVLFVGYSIYDAFSHDVTVLRTQFPVVHYMGRGRRPEVTIEKKRPPGWAPLGSISRVAVGAIIVSEDWAFYQHAGYDMNQIKEAIKEDLEAGSFVRGASTITQQVARNVFLDKDKNLWRKLKELIVAIQMEEKLGKRKILETYLNVAEWGEGVFGIGQASSHYFGKHPSQLTAKEGAFLAMLLPSPKRYSQSFRNRKLTPYARKTVNRILLKMTQAQYISDDQRAQAIGSPFAFEKSSSSM